MRVTPKESESLDVLPKDITFVVDASTSISPRKLTLTKRGIEAAMDVLRPGDRFNIIVFRDSPRQFRALSKVLDAYLPRSRFRAAAVATSGVAAAHRTGRDRGRGPV